MIKESIGKESTKKQESFLEKSQRLSKIALEKTFEKAETLWEQVEANPEEKKTLFQNPNIPLESKVLLGLLEDEVEAPKGWEKRIPEGRETSVTELKKQIGDTGVSIVVIPGEGKKKLNMLIWGEYHVRRTVKELKLLPYLSLTHGESLMEDFGGSAIVTIDQEAHPLNDPSILLKALSSGQIDAVYTHTDSPTESRHMGEYAQTKAKAMNVKKPVIRWISAYSEGSGYMIMDTMSEQMAKSKEEN